MAVIKGEGTSLTFNGVLVGRVTQYETIDGVTPDVPHRPMKAKTNYYLPGVAEFGQVALTLYRDLSDPGQIEMENARAASRVVPCVLTLSDGSVRNFPAFVKTLPIVGNDNGIGPARAVLKVAGAVS